MKILSFQSHVAHGHVGNSAAQFALQRLGFEVVPVHSVAFSNHPGYGRFRGRALDAAEIVDGLDALGVLAGYDAILSGYLGTPENGRALLRVLNADPNAPYVCDPVMGDDGKTYVAAGIPDFIRTHALPRAAMITPNLFELGLLSAMPTQTIDQIAAAARSLSAAGPDLVVVTSIDLAGDCACMAVSGDDRWIVRTPRLPFAHPVNGAGDLLAALLTAEMLNGKTAPEMLENAVSRLYAVLETSLTAGRRELALVAAQDRMKSPPRRFSAMR